MTYYNEHIMRFKVLWKSNLVILDLVCSNQFMWYPQGLYVILSEVVACPLPFCFKPFKKQKAQALNLYCLFTNCIHVLL